MSKWCLDGQLMWLASVQFGRSSLPYWCFPEVFGCLNSICSADFESGFRLHKCELNEAINNCEFTGANDIGWRKRTRWLFIWIPIVNNISSLSKRISRTMGHFRFKPSTLTGFEVSPAKMCIAPGENIDKPIKTDINNTKIVSNRPEALKLVSFTSSRCN